MKNNIGATAFLVCVSRAKQEELSEDPFAKEMIAVEQREDVLRYWEEYASEVYPNDDIVLAVRNSFFLNQLRGFTRDNPESLFINLGAGFTSYPLVLNQAGMETIEVDLPEVSGVKQQRLSSIFARHAGMSSDINFLTADFNDAKSRGHLVDEIKTKMDRPCFVLMEGVSYYLKPQAFKALVKDITDVLPPNSVLAMDYWDSDIVKSEVFRRQQRFFASRAGFDAAGYNLLANEELSHFDGMQIIDSSDTMQEYKNKAQPKRKLTADDMLMERYAVLQKTAAEPCTP